MGPEGVDTWTMFLLCSATCWGVKHTIRARLLASNPSIVMDCLLPVALLSAFTGLVFSTLGSWGQGRFLEVATVEDGIAAPVFNIPEFTPMLLPSLLLAFSWCFWEILGPADCGVLGPVNAGGNTGDTGTVAAKVDVLPKSKQTEPAVLLYPLPGTRTKDRTKSPVSCGATILED